MDARDKLIGIAMILAGTACVVLGSAFLVRSNVSNQQTPNNDVYNEQQFQNGIYQEAQ